MTSDSKPTPLVSADVDLRDFPRMPFDVARLRRSKAWLIAKKNPEVGFYMLNLWMAAWHELPAGSLEDDDDVLADMAMCKPDRWPKVREQVMRNWTLCDDGRLYHQTVAEMVLYAWESKQSQRKRTSAATAARLAKTKVATTDVNGDGRGRDDARDVQRHEQRDVPRDVPATFTKGEGEGKGESSEAKASAAASLAAPASLGLPGIPPLPEGRAMTVKDRLWELGTAVLGEKGRGLIGKHVATYGEPAVLEALQACAAEQPGEPKAWLTKALEARAKSQPRLSGKPGDPVTNDELLRRDPKPDWAIAAGFENVWQAESAGCTPNNFARYRNGRRVEA